MTEPCLDEIRSLLIISRGSEAECMRDDKVFAEVLETLDFIEAKRAGEQTVLPSGEVKFEQVMIAR